MANPCQQIRPTVRNTFGINENIRFREDSLYIEINCGLHGTLDGCLPRLPGAAGVFPNFDGLLAWLRKKGVSHIFDVSLGADICT